MDKYTLVAYMRQNSEKMLDLKEGRIVEVMNKHYVRCDGCDSIVRVDKPIFGDLHFCEEQNGNTY